MANTKISKLFIYPVKSLAGVSLKSSELDDRGLKYDRNWMIVSSDGVFLSQRKTPKMALIKTAIKNDQLVLSHNDQQNLNLPLNDNPQAETMMVFIWKDTVQAQIIGTESDAWLSKVLGVDCHLVRIGEDTLRQCDLNYAKKGDQTGFADGFPLLVLSELSMDDLNRRLEKSGSSSVDVKRFRPNIVISDCDAYTEDTLGKFSIANVAMQGVKLCERCVMTTVDPEKGERAGKEPLATLSQYRRFDNHVCFGMNVIHQNKGAIKVGDELTVG